jgi:hypothetical protein
MFSNTDVRTSNVATCNSWSYLYFKFRFLYLDDIMIDLDFTDPRHHIAQVTKFCKVVPNIFGFSVWNLLHVSLMVPGILRRLVGFWKICVLPVALPLSCVYFTHCIILYKDVLWRSG